MVRKIVPFVLLTVLLAACGFHLREAVELPEGMNQVYTTGFLPDSPFPNYLSKGLDLSGGAVVAKREKAGLILHALNEQFLRQEVSLSQAGKANQYKLTYILSYELQDPAGKLIQPPRTLTIEREYFNPQVNIIGKTEEEGLIRKEMYDEAVYSLFRSVEVTLRHRSSAH